VDLSGRRWRGAALCRAVDSGAPGSLLLCNSRVVFIFDKVLPVRDLWRLGLRNPRRSLGVHHHSGTGASVTFWEHSRPQHFGWPNSTLRQLPILKILLQGLLRQRQPRSHPQTRVTSLWPTDLQRHRGQRAQRASFRRTLRPRSRSGGW